MIFETVLLLVGGSALLALYFVTTRNKREKIDFRGKHVVITGGSSGIGWALSVDAFKQGANVSIIARNKHRLNSIKTELERIQSQSETFSSQIIQIESVDISKNFEETKQAFDRLVSKAGPVDILINNAGIFKSLEFTETSPKDFEDMMRINYMGSVYCTKAVVDSMKSRHFGRIVFVSSQAGQIGIFGYTAYSATKFALRGFCECLQAELKPYGIYITLSYPPDTDTPGLKEENITKPEETRLLADASGVLSSEVVSSEIIKSVKRGDFHCVYGINGFLLKTVTCGCAPVITFKEALIELFALPLTRFIMILLLFNFDSIVKSCYKKKAKY